MTIPGQTSVLFCDPLRLGVVDDITVCEAYGSLLDIALLFWLFCEATYGV